MTARCGIVTLVGWTNVGKSTLLNRLIGERIAAVADVAQTTRTRVLGIWNDDFECQWLFLDTPGFHRPRHRMNRIMVRTATESLREADAVFHLVDASKGVGPGDRETAERLRVLDLPVATVLNKVDRVTPKSKLLPMMQALQALNPEGEVFPISATTGEGVDRLVERARRWLPDGPPRFDAEQWTDQPERALAAEYIREEVLHRTREELPHVTAVHLDRWEEEEEGEGLLRIHARIVVDRDSQKGIVIGKGGERLKAIGTAARLAIESLLGRRVHLQLWVAVVPGWRDDRTKLREFGLT